MPKTGSAAFLSQSGALCTALLDIAGDSLGFSLFVSTGNKALIEERLLIDYLIDDPQTKTIYFLFRRHRGWQRAACGRQKSSKERQTRDRLKGEVTPRPAHGHPTHTRARLPEAAQPTGPFSRKLEFIKPTVSKNCATSSPSSRITPLPQGKRVAIITNAGGVGVLATDCLAKQGLEVAAFSEALQTKLKSILPGAASALNPIDLLGDAPKERYRDALEILGSSDEADLFLVILTPQSMTDALGTAEALIAFRKQSKETARSGPFGRQCF
ncbi:MAG: hypothetical protein WDN67_04000 [Candidatus Moraniibacteriota bacterium]